MLKWSDPWARQISNLRLWFSRALLQTKYPKKKILKVFPLLVYIKIKWPHGMGQFWPWDHDFSELGRGPIDNATH